MKKKLTYVDSLQKFYSAKRELTEASTLCLDTEYDSFRYFREKLCLLQIATNKNVYIFDPLGNVPLRELGNVFANPSQVKVFHAGENDLRLLKRDYGFVFNNIFDTQRAASLVGCKYLALSKVAEAIIGVNIEKNKAIQRSRWDIRPLSEEQIFYAANDVRYLLPIYEELKTRLQGKLMLKQMQEVFTTIAEIQWKPRQFDSNGYKRIKGFRELAEVEQNRLRRLYRWRFHKAQLLDRAVFRIMSDKELLLMAKYSEQKQE